MSKQNKDVEALKQQLKELTRERNQAIAEKQKVLKRVLQSRATRSTLMIVDEDRDYVKELQTIILERLGGSANPTFMLKNDEIVVRFDEIGPQFKLVIRGPLKRIKASPGLRTPQGSEYKVGSGQ